MHEVQRAVPGENKALQEKCGFGSFADDVDQCPGNRRWIQLYYDAMLLMPVGPSMLDARDAMLAADQNRFGGANQTELWRGSRGAAWGIRRGQRYEQRPGSQAELRVACRVQRSDTDLQRRQSGAARRLDDCSDLRRLVRGRRHADRRHDPATNEPSERTTSTRRRSSCRAGMSSSPRLRLRPLPLPADRGGKRERERRRDDAAELGLGRERRLAFGNGVNHQSLIDDTETPTGPASTRRSAWGRLRGRGSRRYRPARVRRLQVSAMLRPADDQNSGDPAGQNRFTALRAFEIWTCSASVGERKLHDAAARLHEEVLRARRLLPGTAPRPCRPT